MPEQKSILLVEDDNFLRGLSEKKLTKEGYKIFAAESGDQALKMAKDNKPNLILLDIILPGVGGFELLKLFKADPELSHTPVILFTNLGTEEDVETGKALGAEDFFIKAHFSLDEISEKIRKYLI